MMNVGWTVINFSNRAIDFLVLGAYIAGLVIAILNRRLAPSMILVIVGFGGQVGVWVFQQLVGALMGAGPEWMLVVQFFGVFVHLAGAAFWGLLVWGLYLVFSGARRRLGLDPEAPRRRRRIDEAELDDEDDDRPARGPRNSGSRDVRR